MIYTSFYELIQLELLTSTLESNPNLYLTIEQNKFHTHIFIYTVEFRAN